MSTRPVASLSPLPDTALELWLIDLDTMAGALADTEAACPRLSPQEEERAIATSDPTVRRRWRSAHIALRILLERWGGAVLRTQAFQIAPGGRPSLAAPAPYFSLSHSGSLALIALTRVAPLGVDIEAIAARSMSASRRGRLLAFANEIAGRTDFPIDGAASGLLTPHQICADAESAVLIQAWCRVEAFAKADGRGLHAVLKEAGIMGPSDKIAPRGDRQPGADGSPALTNGSGPDVNAARRGACQLSGYRAWDIPLGNEWAGYAAAVALARAARVSSDALVPRVLENIEAASTGFMRQADFVLSPPEDGG